MPDMANLTSAMVFVVRSAVGVGYGLGPKREHRQNQRQGQQTDGERFSHGVFPDDPSLMAANMARVTCGKFRGIGFARQSKRCESYRSQ